MATYMVEMHEECGGSETISIEADSIDDARELAAEETAEWVRGGDYGIEGAVVEAHWKVVTDDEDDDDDWRNEGRIVVEIEPDHDALIRAAGGDPDCDHDWTSEGESGCRENPGTWSLGGTRLSFTSHCRRCGLHRREVSVGSQRNPGEHDTVEYTQPDSWCPDCEPVEDIDA